MFPGSKNIFLIPILLAMLSACTGEGCYEEIDSMLKMTLYEGTILETTSLDSITVFGLGLEDELLYDTTTVSSVSIPLFAGSTNSSFVIRKGSITDTIYISYSNQHNFVSKACGYNYLHTIESVSSTKHGIDTVLIIINKVSPNEEENLRTFY